MTAPLESPLTEIIRREIENTGSISFPRFMRLALYHPNFGFYRRRRRPFGKHGDFFTASQLQPVFGEVVAHQTGKLIAQLREPETIVLDLGAGGQELSAALGHLNYRAYDWNSVPLPRGFKGVVFANEFFDALPLHLLRLNNGGWQQLRVASGPNGFHFVDAPASNILIRSAERHRKYVAGDVLEIRPAVRTWLKRIARILDRGFLLIIDYGHSNRELLRFPHGSLLSYRKHAAEDDVLKDPGERDITAHVNFSDLLRAARREGFVLVSDCSLRSWLLSAWEEEELQGKWVRWSEKEKLQWKLLTFELGETFRVLLLSRGIHFQTSAG